MSFFIPSTSCVTSLMPSDFRSLASVSPSKYVTAAFTGSAYEITENQVI